MYGLLTNSEAKKMVVKWLNDRGILSWKSIRSKTLYFDGSPALFVLVAGWEPNPAAEALRQIGRENGFVVSFEGDFVQG